MNQPSTISITANSKIKNDNNGGFMSQQSLNKREQLAFDNLIRLLESLAFGASYSITTAEYNAIKLTFGTDLKEVTCRKKDINTLVRGKLGHLVFIKPFSGWHLANSVNAHGCFAYQVKPLKPTGRE